MGPGQIGSVLMFSFSLLKNNLSLFATTPRDVSSVPNSPKQLDDNGNGGRRNIKFSGDYFASFVGHAWLFAS